MKKVNGNNLSALRVERSFVKVIDSLSPEKGEEVIPKEFAKTFGHTCCVPDCVILEKINNADLKKTALEFAKTENISLTQAQQVVNFYYSS